MSATSNELDELIDEITVDCSGKDEQLCGFLTAIEEELTEPVAATVIGASVELLAIDYNGDSHRGLVASCRREDTTHDVSALDVIVAEDSRLSRLLAAYRYWASPGSASSYV